MKLRSIIESTKIKVSEDTSYDDLRVAKYLCRIDGMKFKGYGRQSEYISKAEELRNNENDKYKSILRQPSPSSDDSWASANLNLKEGEERSIIQSGCVEKLVDEFRGEEHQFENRGDLEYAIYQELERLNVEDCVDPDMEHGGQRMGDFASGGVLNVIDSSSVIDDVIEQLDTSDLEEGRIEDTFGTKTIDKHDKPGTRKKGKRVDEFLPAVPAILTGLRLLGPIILRHATKDAVKKAVVGKVGGEAVKKAVVQGAKGTAKVTKDVIKKAAPVAGKVGKEIGKKAVGPAVGGAVVVGGVSYVVDQVFDKVEEALKFLADLFGDLFEMETLKKIAEMLVKYGLPIAGVLAVAYGGKVLVDYIRSEGDDPEEYDDELIHEAESNMIGQPDNFYDAEQRQEAYKELQDALNQSSNVEAMYVKDGHCPECPNVEDDEDCYGFGNYGCDDGELTYNNEPVSWKAIKDHDESQAERQQAKDNYPGDEAVIDFAASTAKQLKKSGQDPRDTLEYMRKEYPGMGRAQRASLVAKGMKKAGLANEGKSPHKKGSAKYKKHMAAMHAGMGEGMNEELQIQKIRNSKGEIIQYTILNGEPFDVNGAPLEYGPYWDIMTADGHSDIEINSHMWPDYERNNAGIKGYESIQAGDELMIETGMGEGVIAPVIHVVGENVLISWDATADSLFEETEEIDEGEKHGNSKIYNKCWKGYSKVPGKSAGEKGSCKKNEDIEETSFDQNAFDEVFKDRKSKIYMDYLHALRKSGKINMFGAPRELQREFGLSKEQSYEVFNTWKDSFTDDRDAFIRTSNEDLQRMRHLAGLDENNLMMFASPDEVKKHVAIIQKTGFPMSGKFTKWCEENNCTFTMDFNNPKNLQMAAIAKIKFEKETGYGTDGELLNRKPPAQKELPFSPRNKPEQQEFDFESDLDEAEYQGRKVKLGKPTRGDVKKFKVYVKDPKTGNVKKVNFGHGGSSAKKAGQKTMKIKKSNPARRKSFRARHNCDNPGPRTKARYWSCRAW